MLAPFRVMDGQDGENLEITERFIEVGREGYENTKNPLYVWQAYQEARAAGITVPEWILEYLDESAAALWELRSRSEKLPNPTAAIAEALRLKKPGRSGSGTVFSEVENNAWIEHGYLVHYHMRAELKEYGRAKLSQMVANVASLVGVSESSIWRSLKKYETQFVEPEKRLSFKK